MEAHIPGGSRDASSCMHPCTSYHGTSVWCSLVQGYKKYVFPLVGNPALASSEDVGIE